MTATKDSIESKLYAAMDDTTASDFTCSGCGRKPAPNYGELRHGYTCECGRTTVAKLNNPEELSDAAGSLASVIGRFGKRG